MCICIHNTRGETVTTSATWSTVWGSYMASCDNPGQGLGWQMDAPLLTYLPQRSAWCQSLQCHQQRGSGTESQQWENVLSDNIMLHQHNTQFLEQQKPHSSRPDGKQGTTFSQNLNSSLWWVKLTFQTYSFCCCLQSLMKDLCLTNKGLWLELNLSCFFFFKP